VSAIGTAVGIIATKVRGRSLARRILGQKAPDTPVAVYFADAPSSLYQLRRWYRTLEALNAVHPTSIILSDPATYDAVRAETTLAVTYADGAEALGRALRSLKAKVILYPNHNALNFRMLRFAGPVHIFIGHGESAKESSVSRQLKAYDYTWVASATSIDQLREIRGYDADKSTVVVGSPWLGFLGSPPASWHADDREVVLYAPTWEGDRPTMDYSSVESYGEAIVAAVLGSPGLRLIYRPHPWLGRVRKETAAADARIRKTLAGSDRGAVIDSLEYGWALTAADLCVTDVSSVAFDARALGTPLVVTKPTSASIPPVADSAYRGATILDLTDVEGIRTLLESTLAEAKEHPAPSSTSMDALLAAIAKALEVAVITTL
jgi:hypothetical protein